MSGEQIDQTAPWLTLARNATIAWGMLGKNAHTRSPGRTPMRCNAAPSEATWRRSSLQPSVSIWPAPRSRSFWNTIAGHCAASLGAVCVNRCSA